MTPVALGVEVAQHDLAGVAGYDARHRGDLPGHELEAAARRFVVEQS
jgi:hypothetical protein